MAEENTPEEKESAEEEAWVGNDKITMHKGYPHIGGKRIVTNGSSANVKRGRYNEIIEVDGEELARDSKGRPTFLGARKIVGDIDKFLNG